VYVVQQNLEVAVGVGDEDVKRLIIAEFPVTSPPLDLWQWVSVDVTRHVMCLAGPDEHASSVVAREPRLV